MKTLAADRAVSAEGALNSAIVNADITRGFEEYLALVDQYYAEDVEVSTDTSPEPVVGRDRLKSILFRFLGATSHDRRDRWTLGVDPRSLNTWRFH
jgi:hypothetical protein